MRASIKINDISDKFYKIYDKIYRKRRLIRRKSIIKKIINDIT